MGRYDHPLYLGNATDRRCRRVTLASLCAMFAFSLLVVAPAPALAQSVSLTPAQQQMLNSLPPAQREQALEVLRQQSGQVQRIREPLVEREEGPAADLSPTVTAEPDGGIQRAGSNSRLVIDFTPLESMSMLELTSLRADPVLSRLEGSRTFILDENGNLSLLGIETVPLLGLTESDIVRRLGAEPMLSQFDVDVRILESQPSGAEALEPFGYDIFEPNEAGFDPPMTGPVPMDYTMGPGDSVRVQLFGNVNGIYEIDVSRDGVVNLPEIGPVTVSGLSFSEFREDVFRRVDQMLIGTQVSVTMGQLRTIRVFVLGDANRPGSYVVDSLATITSALYRSGGVSRVGSLRDIQLKRGGEVVARLDLYDLLLRGDTSGDSRLQPGDVIFVAPIGSQVSVTGAVKRPAIYEVSGNTTVADVIEMSGGLTADAYSDGARIERIQRGRDRIVVSVDAAGDAAGREEVMPGDLLMVPTILPEFDRIVTLAGHVHRPGAYQWRDNMRLADLIDTAAELKPGADLDYILIRREDPTDRTISVASANLGLAMADSGSIENIELRARDTVYVFNVALGRQRIIKPLLDELQLQSDIDNPHAKVSISGSVKAPGTYPLEPDMTVSDLIRAGGGLAEEAYTLRAELARYEIIGDETRSTQIFDINLAANDETSGYADLRLKEHDNVRINQVPEWDSLSTVRLEGEVRFPGDYRFRSGETLRQVLERAGGLTEDAFPEGAIFLRETLREREQEQIDLLVTQLESDLVSYSLQDSGSASANILSTGETLLAQLRSTQAVGRLVVDAGQLTNDGGRLAQVAEVELRQGDRLLVPKVSQEVTVIGETQQQTSHLHQSGLNLQDYIELSGGLTRRADKKLIYVVRASGAVETAGRSRWFGRSDGIQIKPGDTIVVPLEVDKIRPLTLWTQVTQILYQAAIALAAVDSFGN